MNICSFFLMPSAIALGFSFYDILREMKKLLRNILIIITLLLTVGAFYFLGDLHSPESTECPDLPSMPSGSEGVVTKVVDGDTFLIEGGYSVRLLGIDADERGYPCYDEAKDRLEDMVFDRKVRLIAGPEDHDQYCRYLRYPFLEDNISLSLVEEGLVVTRFYPGNNLYKEQMIEAENEAREQHVGCKWPETEGEITEVGACQAKDYVGQEAVVVGRVSDTHYAEDSDTVFLNMEGEYPNQCFTGVIFSSDLHRFNNPEDYYFGKMVKIRGMIEMYKGRPEIVIQSPNQIENE